MDIHINHIKHSSILDPPPTNKQKHTNSCDFLVGWNIHSRPRKKSPKTTVNIFQLSCSTSKSLFSPPNFFKTSPNLTVHLQHQKILSQLFSFGGKESQRTVNFQFHFCCGFRRVQGGFGHWCFLSFSSLLDCPNLEPVGSGAGWTSWGVELKDVGCWKPQEIAHIYLNHGTGIFTYIYQKISHSWIGKYTIVPWIRHGMWIG